MRRAPNTGHVVRSAVLLVIAAASVSTLEACDAVLGLTEPTLRTDGDDGDDDGAARGDATATATDGGCTAIVETDPSNCGRCGHDCLGGECKGGRCMPVRIATGFRGALDLVGDDRHLYLSSTQGILRFPRTDLTKPEIVAPGSPGWPSRVAVLGTDLFYARTTKVIDTCKLPDCAVETRVASNVGGVYGGFVAVKNYFGSHPLAWLDVSNGIVAVPQGDGGVRTIATVISGGSELRVVGSPATLYWSESQAKRFRKALPGTYTIIDFDVAPHAPNEFVILGETIVFATTGSVLMRGTLRGAAVVDVKRLPLPPPLDAGSLRITRLESDERHVYLGATSDDADIIRRCDIDTGCADDDILVSDIPPNRRAAMLVDDDRVYYVVATTEGDDALYSIAK